MNTLLWVTTIVLVIGILSGIMYFLIRDANPFYAAFKGCMTILAGVAGGNVILPYIVGTTSVDFSIDDILKIHSSEMMIEINPPDREDKDKSNTIYCVTGLTALSLTYMFYTQRRRP